jgi:phage repressor protein C with HTH and peptisase S24 domain
MKKSNEILKEVISYCETNYHQLAKSLNLKRSQNLYDIRDGKVKISGNLAAKIVALKPEININYLLTGEGSMLHDEQENAPIEKSEQAYENADDEKPIYLYDVSAAAGYGSFDMLITKDRIVGEYKIPAFKGVDWMIYVKGSSMYPKYSSGDIIACRELNESKFIQWGKVYVVGTREQGLLVKRLEQSEKEDCLRAVSDNEAYKPFDIPVDEIIGIALVVGVIRLE